MEISRLTRDGTAEPVSRYQILRHAREQGNAHFPCSADHEQDWRPYLVDPYSAIICDDHTYIIHTYTECGRCYAFGCMVAIRGGYRIDRGWHYAKLSISNALRLSFFGMYVYFVILVPLSLSFLFVCVFLFLSLELGRCSSDIFLSSIPRTGLATTYITGYG